MNEWPGNRPAQQTRIVSRARTATVGTATAVAALLVNLLAWSPSGDGLPLGIGAACGVLAAVTAAAVLLRHREPRTRVGGVALIVLVLSAVSLLAMAGLALAPDDFGQD